MLISFIYNTTAKSFGMDLMSLNIQRARDHGIPPYLHWREACGLTQIHNWGQLLSIMEHDTVGRLRVVYKYVSLIQLISLFSSSVSNRFKDHFECIYTDEIKPNSEISTSRKLVYKAMVEASSGLKRFDGIFQKLGEDFQNWL